MHKSTLEQQINEMSDLEELDRIACENTGTGTCFTPSSRQVR